MEEKAKEKVFVALSGGVDSAVAAYLLKEQGYEVSAGFMRTWMNEGEVFADCPWEEDLKNARAVADFLEIDFEIINLIEDYRNKVVKYLVDGYKKGITPNPDIMCNREIKFGVLLEHALEKGCDYMATGHYVRKVRNEDGRFDICEGRDKNKDQSYFLALLGQEQIERALFPIGELEKPRVREIAKEAGLPNAQRKDSQGICFLGKVPINEFLKNYIQDIPGEIVNLDGDVLGRHKGLHRYTLGQRRGIGVPSNADFENYVVVGKDLEKNQLRIAFENEETPGLWMQSMRLRYVSFVNEVITQEVCILAKPRYRDPSQKIHYKPLEHGEADIVFDEKQRALASGQVLALYDGERLLGGGFYV